MYTVGSLADLISGSKTPNKPKVEIQQVQSKPYKQKKTEVSVEKSKQPQKRKANDDVPEKPKRAKTDTKKDKFSPDKVKKIKQVKLNESLETPKKPKTGESPEKEPISENAKAALKRMKDRKKETFRDPEKEARTIFIGNVPIQCKKEEMRTFFKKYGTIESVRFRCAARKDLSLPKKAAFLMKQIHPKAAQMVCYIVFKEEDSVAKAVVENGSLFKEHHIRVDFVAKPAEKVEKNAIFVGNVPFAAKDDDLWKIFENCGKIESVRVVRDGLTGIGKGYGYVNFESPDAVELAMQMGEVTIGKRELRVKRCTTDTKKKSEKV